MGEYTRNDKYCSFGRGRYRWCILHCKHACAVFRKNTEKLWSFYGFP